MSRQGRFSLDNFKVIRDVLLFVAGLTGVFYETVFTRADRPTLLLLYAAMLGLPAFLHSDERGNVDGLIKRKSSHPDNEEDEEDDQEKPVPKANSKHKHEADKRRMRRQSDDPPPDPRYADG